MHDMFACVNRIGFTDVGNVLFELIRRETLATSFEVRETDVAQPVIELSRA